MSSSVSSRSRSVVQIGLFIALIAVSAWIVVPIGPVPFTLQMFAISLMICLLPLKEATIAIVCYLVLGAIGVPVFSGMRGGIGVILGPTGGFLFGYLLAVPIACLVFKAGRALAGARGATSDPDLQNGAGGGKKAISPKKKSILSFLGRFGNGIVAGLVFTSIAYVFGCAYYMFVGNVSFGVAFATCLAPFIVPDIIKVTLASICATSIQSALVFSRQTIPAKEDLC